MQINFSSGFYHGREIAATKLPYDSGFEVKFLKDFCCICGKQYGSVSLTKLAVMFTMMFSGNIYLRSCPIIHNKSNGSV